MPENLGEVLGQESTITLKGKQYRVSPWTLGDFAALTQYVRSERLKLFLKQAKKMEPEDRKGIVSDILSGDYDFGKEASSMAGTRFLVWRSLKKHQPELKLNDIDDLVSDPEEFVTLVGKLSGVEIEPEAEEAKGPPVEPGQ